MSWEEVDPKDVPERLTLGEVPVFASEHYAWYAKKDGRVVKHPSLGLVAVDPAKDLAAKVTAVNSHMKSAALSINGAMTALVNGQGSVGSAQSAIAQELSMVSTSIKQATDDIMIDAQALAKPPVPTGGKEPPPPGVDPATDVIRAIQVLQGTSAKAQAAGGTLSQSDWAAVDANIADIARDVAEILRAPAQPPAATGMTPIQAGLAGAGAGAVLGGLAGFAIGRATAGGKGPAPTSREGGA
jgi:hypothetical protein